MTISESQLTIWSNQGATDSAQKTHSSLRNALDTYEKWPVDTTYDTYLQGSYRNTTNIRGDSDVDLVIELTSVSYSNLTDAEKALLKLGLASYKWNDFRNDVIAALIGYYGAQFVDTSGSKSVKVLPNSGRLKADVVVAANYKYYENLRVRAEGMTFWTLPSWQQVVNYPKLHYEKGATKNSAQRTNGWYKPTIRIFKNARNRVTDTNPFFRGHFPSYFVEGLLYNVPDRVFGGTYQATFLNILNRLGAELGSDRATSFVCQNEMAYLFGASSVQWNIDYAREYVTQLIQLWKA